MICLFTVILIIYGKRGSIVRKTDISALSVILAVLMLFASAVVFTSCEGPGGALLNEPDGKAGPDRRTLRQRRQRWPCDNPILQAGNDSSSQGDAAGRMAAGPRRQMAGSSRPEPEARDRKQRTAEKTGRHQAEAVDSRPETAAKIARHQAAPGNR